MPSVEAANALLTAVSIVVAGTAILLNQLSLEGLHGRSYMVLGLFAGFSMATLTIAFAEAIFYLHSVEYPSGFVASTFSPQVVFNIATGTLVVGLIFGYISFTYYAWNRAL